MAQEPTSRNALDEIGIEAICDRLADGESQTAIAASLNISKSSLCKWIALDEKRSARAREARILAASAYADLALAAIKDAPDPFNLAKARELASHYRWQASKASPGEYGDKMTLAGDPANPLKIIAGTMTDEDLARIAVLKQ